MLLPRFTAKRTTLFVGLTHDSFIVHVVDVDER